MNLESDVRSMVSRSRLVLSHDEFAGVCRIVNETRHFAPVEAVVERFEAGALTPAMLTLFLPRMWMNRPDNSAVPTRVWRAMFEHTLYTEDTVARRRPRRAQVAYRGATEANREGLSWSLDVEQARYFARSRQAPGDSSARVWATRIPGDRVFARFMEGWEKELTADVRGLDVRPLEEWRPPRVLWGRRSP